MLKVLMIGPSRNTKGGVSTVINNYYKYGLSDKVKLKYIETINDKNIFIKFIKEKIALVDFLFNIGKYDILHAHLASRRSAFRKSMYIRIAKRKNKYIVAHIHGGGFKKFLDEECSNKKRMYIINSLNMCDKIIVLSKEWYEYFSTFIDKKKLIIIENSVYVPCNNYSTQDNYNILFLGRLEKDKGIYDLLESFSYVVDEYKNAKLYIAGSGENDLVEKKIKKLGILKNIVMLGWISNDETTKIIKSCSLFVLPSYFEAMPMSLLESMAFGCIPVASNVGGIPYVIKDEVNGFLVTPGDIIELKNKILKIFNKSTDERKIISNNAYNTIFNKYNIKKSLDKIIEVYNEKNKRKTN